MPSDHPHVVLASGSPRRRELLEAIDIRPEIRPADIDETPLDGERPAAYVERLARAKAERVAANHPGAIVIGADTTVAVDGVIVGKPTDDANAGATLRRLSGRSHDVYTGVATAVPGAIHAATSHTIVSFRELSDHEIDWYVSTGEAAGKAGSYAIQGAAGSFVTHIEGSHDNVIGLPRALLDELLGRTGRSLHELRTPAH